jgi:DNA polymerase-3 subunit delta
MNILKDYTIDKSTVRLINEYALGDITKIENDCRKLMDYCLDSKVINKEDVLELVVQKLGDSKDLTFSFIRSLGEKDKSSALTKYKELLDYNIEPLALIGLVASQIRIIYQVKSLENNKLSDKEMADLLGEKEFRVKKTREITRLYSEKELLKLMIDLSDIDLKCKSSDVDPNYLIDVFLLKM